VRENQAPLHVDDRYAVGFRGYTVEPTLHGYSDSASVIAEFADRHQHGRNGVYSCIVFDRQQHKVSLLSDTLGFGPLYYRRSGELWLFATNPRYLAMRGDRPDMLAWLSLLQTGSIVGDRTLTQDVHRLEAGTTLTIDRHGATTASLDTLLALPSGDRRADEHTVQEVEDAFQTAMERILALSDHARFLPLSSGHDSRRILAALSDRQEPFTAHTVRVHQKGFRDLDANFAALMAEHFGFHHEVIAPPSPREFALDDLRRRILTDGESRMHSWALPLMARLPASPALLFDGVLGDILGNPGFRMPGMYRSNEADRDIIIDAMMSNAYDRWLNWNLWPGTGELRQELRDFIDRFLDRPNMAEFIFILLRQRRMISPWSQQLVAPGHVVVCPYLDLDYLRLLLSIRPADKHRIIFQRACLEAFWPEYARFGGNRDIPSDLPAGDPRMDESAQIACEGRLQSELARSRACFNGLYSRLGRVRVASTRISRSAWRSSTWLTQPLLELTSREVRREPCWEVR